MVNLCRNISMLCGFRLAVPVMQNNIHIIRMLLKRSIPGNIQHPDYSGDLGVCSAQWS